MITDNPTHLNCPWCPAQSYPEGTPVLGYQHYRCPAHHHFLIETEDVSFNYGHNKED
jgi:hypothetical protein